VLALLLSVSKTVDSQKSSSSVAVLEIVVSVAFEIIA
jgi:hypothetical protein